MRKNNLSFGLLLAAIFTLGLWGLFQLEFRLFPPIQDPMLEVALPINQPEEFLSSLAPLLIQELERNPSVDEVLISVKESVALISVSLHPASSRGLAQSQVQEQFEVVLNKNSWSGERPLFRSRNRHEVSLMELHITGSDLAGSRAWVNEFLLRRLWMIEGVGRLEIIGGTTVGYDFIYREQFHDSVHSKVKRDMEMFQAVQSDTEIRWIYPGIEVDDFLNNEIVPAVRAREIFQLRIKRAYNSGQMIRDGQPAQGLRIFSTEDADVLSVSRQVRACIEELNVEHPMYKIEVFNDRSEIFLSAFDSMRLTIASAIILCSCLIWVVFRTIRLCLWIGLVLLLTLNTAVLICVVFSVTLDLISLSGLILGIGLLVDNPIIVGESFLTSGCSGVRQVRGSLLVSNVTTLLVFLPVLWIVPQASVLFGGMILAVVLLIFLSMTFALMLSPWLKKARNNLPFSIHKRIFTLGPRAFKRIIGVVVFALVFAVAFSPLLNIEYLPRTSARVWKKAGIDVELPDAGAISHVIQLFDSGLSTLVEFETPQAVGSEWTSADDPFHELLESYSEFRKWYRPDKADGFRKDWDGFAAKPHLTWKLDTTVAISPVFTETKEIIRNGKRFGWSFRKGKRFQGRSQLKPQIRYQPDVTYLDRVGVFKKASPFDYGMTGDSEILLSNYRIATILMGLTIGFISFLWLYFGSMRLSLIAFVAFPLSIAGSILALTLSDSSLNLFSGAAVVFTSGVSINDAVLKIDAFKEFLRHGHSFKDAIELSSLYRLRPIFLTSLTTLGSSLVLWFWAGSYDHFNASVAIAIAGGITFSSFGAIWVIPLLLSRTQLGIQRTVQPTA